MSVAYLACLLVSLAGMGLLDWRHRLFWFASPGRAGIVHAAGLGFFLLWDAVGIGFGVFHRGDSPYLTGVDLAPQLPVEEVLFLTFLCWLTMIVFTGALRILDSRRHSSRKLNCRKLSGRDLSGRSQTRPAPRGRS